MSPTSPNQHKSRHGVRTSIPPLLNGDHLTVPEFERRYEAMPRDRRAELIEGIVVIAPPTSDDHSESHSLLSYILAHFAAQTVGLTTGVCGSLRVDGGNEFQPDLFLRIKDGGKSKVSPDRLLEGAPELVAEIAISSASYDLHEKKRVYERCGVQEYLVWQVMDAQFQWFALEKGAYTELKRGRDGIIRSRVFPGLWIDIRALLAGDDLRAIRTLERGLKSAAHKTFAKRLKASR